MAPPSPQLTLICFALASLLRCARSRKRNVCSRCLRLDLKQRGLATFGRFRSHDACDFAANGKDPCRTDLARRKPHTGSRGTRRRLWRKRHQMSDRKETAKQDDERRLARERQTVAAMIRISCHQQHGSLGALCAECSELHDYAMRRLDRCPFATEKPTCAKCPTHCYRPQMRDRIRNVMRYSGPRMLLRHPILALWHLWDSRKSVPGSG